MRLDGLHEQTITRPRPHDELVQLHCVVLQARFGGSEGARVLEALRNWLATASGAKLIWLDPEGRPQRMTAKAAGWQDELYYYLLPETMLSLTSHTIEGNRIGRALADFGLLEPGVHPRSLQFRMGSGIPGRPYGYRILKARFEE